MFFESLFTAVFEHVDAMIKNGRNRRGLALSYKDLASSWRIYLRDEEGANRKSIFQKCNGVYEEVK